MKKRMISVILVICMIFSMLSISAFAADASCLVVSEASLKAGDTFTLGYIVPNSVSGVDSIVLEIGFDNTKFEVTDIVYADIAPLERDVNHTVTQANTNGKFRGEWSSNDDTFETATTISNLKLVEASFVVKESVVTGEADFTVEILSIADEIAEQLISTAGATTVKTTVNVVDNVPDVPATAAYTVALSPETTTVNNDGTASNVTVNVVVNKAFNSAELKLSYDNELLKYEGYAVAQTMGEKDEAVSIVGANGVVTIRDYGTAFAAGNAYTLNFTSIKGGVADVKVTSAGFSTQVEAETKDLIPATIGSSASVTINHKVTVNDEDTTYVAPNGTYNGTIPGYDPHNYGYDVVVKMGGEELEDPVIDENGNFTIRPVTGELVITYTATPNTYNITWTDADNAVADSEQVAQVTYGNPVTFNVAADVAEGEIENGYHYDVLVYLTDDTNKTPIATSSSNNDDGSKTYTIAAEKITGDITIEVSKVIDEADKVKLNVTDSDEVYYNDAPLTTTNVTKNENITLTLKKEIGYTYKVEMFEGDETTGIELTVNEDGTFTVSVGTQPITIKVTKTLNTTGFDVTEYVQLDGTKMWLVKVGNASVKVDLEAGETDRVYTYTESAEKGAKNLFWSNQYNAYCYLVVSDQTNIDTLKSDILSKLSVADGTVTSISYNGNVNLTKDASGEAVIDVNDAQLVWNMYSVVYNSISDSVTVEKFLEADMDGNGYLNVNDAALVVAEIPAN